MGPIRPHHALPSGHRWHASSAVFNVSNLLPFGGEVRLWDSPLLVEIPQLLAASHDDMDLHALALIWELMLVFRLHLICLGAGSYTIHSAVLGK